MFEIIKYSDKLKDNWIKYQNRYPFAKNINYNDIMEKIESVVNLLKKESVTI